MLGRRGFTLLDTGNHNLKGLSLRHNGQIFGIAVRLLFRVVLQGIAVVLLILFPAHVQNGTAFCCEYMVGAAECNGSFSVFVRLGNRT